MQLILLAFALGCIGFTNGISKVTYGESYKIISSFNHKVLHVKDYRTDNQITVIPFEWKQDDVQNQMWSAEEIAPNEFVLSTLANKLYVLDSSKLAPRSLIVYERHEQENQQWIFDQVRENAFSFYIRNLLDNTVIQLNSDHKTVSMAPKDENNFRQRWILAETFKTPSIDTEPSDPAPLPQTTEATPPRTIQTPPPKTTPTTPRRTTQTPPPTTEEPPQTTTEEPIQTTTQEPPTDPTSPLPPISTQPPIEDPTEDPVPVEGCDYITCPRDREIMYFPYKADCSKFCQCSNYVPIEMKCSPTLVFNPNINVCVRTYEYRCPY